ncbi:alpha/beta hydrolase [Skermania piniformis]|uniref:Esterase family protein n=2 Tax=Skermania pinensis TaxID=39122 RepID=A0ABX8SDY9_9ACTN|nr:alpha/beta hydrolase family protein [Skermania piniformis]QXQ14655.1 esterase family protein [Skermania piniformis]
MRRLLVTAALTIGMGTAVSGTTAAAPAEKATTGGAARIVSVEPINDRQEKITVYSAAMDREIPLQVVLPADRSKPQPVLYLLNGVGGGEDSANWFGQTDILDFLKDKNANVVMPMAGRASYYTDWQRDDPVLGRNKWSTFLGKELPPLIDAELGTNKRQSIAAISSSSTSVFNLAIEHPGLYKGIAAFSGCVQSSDSVGQHFVKITVNDWGGGNVENMWGPLGGPDWVAHDPQVNAEKLRGTDIYVSSGTGVPAAPNDTDANPRFRDGRAAMFDQLVVGAPIEVATGVCTDHLAKRLNELQIPATVNIRKTGTHSWGYWQDDFHDAWPLLAKSMGI